MKTRLLIIICIIGTLLIPVNSVQSLPEFLDCTYDSDFVISTNKLEFVPDETFVLNVKTAQNDDSFKVVIIDPKGKEVFADVVDADKNDYAQTKFHIPDNAQRGTWSIFVTANPSHQQEVIFIGVDEPPQSPLMIKPSSVNYEYKIDDAVFLIAGIPDIEVQINIIEPFDDKKHIYMATIPLEGKCSFSLDLEDYKAGVYDVEIIDHADRATAVFTVGLDPSRGVIAIRASSDSYFAGDIVSVLGDTSPDMHLTIDVIDPSENVVDQFFIVSSETGVINTSFNLPVDAKNGTWTVRATSSPNFDSVEFNVTQKSLAEQHEPPVPEPDQQEPEQSSIPAKCGEGTTYQDGICVVEKSPKTPTNSSGKWGTVIDFPPALQPYASKPSVPLFDHSFSITEKQVRYDVFYNVTNASISNVQLNCNPSSLALSLLSSGDGTLQLDIPKGMFGGIFMVLVDDEEWDDVSLDGNVLTVNFTEDTSTIKILGSYYLTTNEDDGVCDVIHNPPHSYIIPPLKQIKSGIASWDVECKDGLTLMFKPVDKKPVCVTGDTAHRLLERHWSLAVSRG